MNVSFGSSASSPANSETASDVGAEDEQAEEENDDPLLSLFRVHNTNRVKFDLTSSDDDGDGDKIIDEQAHESDDNNNNDSPTRRATEKFKKFVRSASFTIKKRSDTTPSNLTASCLLSKEDGPLPPAINDPEDALIKKMWEPTPLRKISSLLGNMRGSGSSEEKSLINQVSFDQSPPFTTIDGINNGNNDNSRTNIPKSSKESLAKLLKKAQRAHKKTFRYRLAMKYYLLALKEMTNTGYSDSDPLMTKVLKSLNDVHHAQSTVANSANIVQMGIQHEDKNQLIKALRMYTIAYRMRRDSLGVDHPSLAVLLNMMGSVQVKRGEYGEAMKIYELSLKGRVDENGGRGRNKDQFRNQNPLTTSVTLRDMGMILEHKGNEDKALKFYHASLRYAVKFKNSNNEQKASKNSSDNGSDTGSARESENNSDEKDWLDTDNTIDEPFSLTEVRMAKSTTMGKSENVAPDYAFDYVEEKGEMELFLEKRFDRWALSKDTAKSDSTKFYYDELYVPAAAAVSSDQQAQQKPRGEGPDVDIAMTLHQIGQIHRRSHRYAAALSAYNASLRGMKEVLGTQHGNIAAILGNIGNLYMETGDYDEAFTIYQEVLGIETMHLGLSHPEVAVTLHNIATIECSRGNFSEGVSLYKQVVDMQKIRYGSEHLTVAITLSCLADAYEKLRNVKGAIKTYEEALKIRIAVLGKSHLDVGRLMHKLGRLASSRKDYAIADIYMMRAVEIYVVNKLQPDHVFMREMARDNADIQAGLAFGKK